MKRQLLRNVFLLSLLLLTSACNERADYTVRIAHNSWPGYEPLVLAESEGLYNEVDVINFRVNSATDAIRAFEHHIVDVVTLTLDEALLLQSNHPEPLVIIAVLDISDGGDAIIAQREINSIQQLKGKRVGVEATALGAFFLARALDTSAELNLEQLQIVPVRANHHHDAFTSKQVDAVVTFEPVKSMLMKKGGNNIFDSTMTPNEIVDVLVTRKSFSETRGEALKGLIQGYFAALKRIAQQPEKYHAIMADFEGVRAESFTRSLSGLHIPDQNTNQQLLGGSNPGLLRTIQSVQRFMLENRIIPHPPHTDISISDDFIVGNSDDK